MGERPSATEPSSPTAANASVGASTLAQASAPRLLPAPARADGRRGPPAAGCRLRRVRRRCPRRPGPPQQQDDGEARQRFAAKIRRGDRTATSRCRQCRAGPRWRRRRRRPETSGAAVPSCSKTSGPPTIPPSLSGSSSGRRPCRTAASSAELMTATINAGPSQQARSARRIGHCASSLISSKR